METVKEIGRSNHEMERAVNRALAKAYMTGVATGAKAMCQTGVPLHVAMRVLLHPRQRRLAGRKE